MRRMEAGDAGSMREYPGIQPLRLTAENQGPWPTYQFGQEKDGWDTNE